MLKTHGLTHISLAVRDPERSLRFYRSVLGVEESYRDDDCIEAKGPGAHDVLAFEKDPSRAGTPGGIAHFGFRLTRAEDVAAAVRAVERAGGRLRRRGEFSPGHPYAYVSDPDGYEIEFWYE
jgi:catechol 2,3-dioxygenase-like lactoylglutathione lyase family enzyme